MARRVNEGVRIKSRLSRKQQRPFPKAPSALTMRGIQQEHSKDQGGGRGGPNNARERIFLLSVVSLSTLSKQTQKVQKKPLFQTGAIET